MENSSVVDLLELQLYKKKTKSSARKPNIRGKEASKKGGRSRFAQEKICGYQ
jgi:hypothetical protein